MIMVMMAMMMLSILTLASEHPMLLAMLTVLQSLMISMFMSMINSISWFSFILFIVFTGGLMVLFIYMTSLAPNEMLPSPKTKTSIKIITMSVITVIILSPLLPKHMMSQMNMTDMEQLIDFSPAISYFFSMPTSLMVITLMTFLLITLAAVNSMMSKKPGPLRTHK
uniref:NADH dehydrogenase subunit 6 n=1 Tax=Xibalbanus tulumensis TaxID=1519145 RepID=Q6SKY2_XIBTU|nr:NADH dehydrogenase subunit 6 [Xibalbanus tulumensis]AAS00891.1 NADH dehydrogenase subunit 6 [Xibalbanus tulumensis]